MIFIIFAMYTDINGVSYKLEGDKAIIQPNRKSCKIEIFPTVSVGNRSYEVVFPDDCEGLFKNEFLEEFKLHKLLNPTTNILHTNYMFFVCKSLKELKLDNLNTDNVNSMESMFANCYNLLTINLSNFNTKSVNSMERMFYCCCNLKELDISNFNTKNVKDISLMFNYCEKLQNLKMFEISNEYFINCVYMFSWCYELKYVYIPNLNNLKIAIYRKGMIKSNINAIIVKFKYIKNHHVYDINCENSYVIEKNVRGYL